MSADTHIQIILFTSSRTRTKIITQSSWTVSFMSLISYSHEMIHLFIWFFYDSISFICDVTDIKLNSVTLWPCISKVSGAPPTRWISTPLVQRRSLLSPYLSYMKSKGRFKIYSIFSTAPTISRTILNDYAPVSSTILSSSPSLANSKGCWKIYEILFELFVAKLVR